MRRILGINYKDLGLCDRWTFVGILLATLLTFTGYILYPPTLQFDGLK